MTGIAQLTVTAAGAQPTPPATIQQLLIALVAATNPGYTANLPASLIEDLTSTMTAGLSQMNQAQVEVVNSLTPFLANPFVLQQFGNLLGISLGLASNTSVSVVFTAEAAGVPQPGVVIAQGFVVSDGQYQYIVQAPGGITGSNGQSLPLLCLASQSGSWAVPANTVTQTATSNPPGIVITANNPSSGTPATGNETQGDYAARVFQGMLAASQGMDRYLKTLLANVPGVQSRLISVRQQVGGGWEVIVGGGDAYQVANAIYTALFDVSTLVGSMLAITAISETNPAVYTTNLAHGLVSGEVVDISSAIPAIYDVSGTATTATVINATAFSLPVNAAAFTAAYVGGAILSPNNRNVSVDILDYPDTYVIPFVSPPEQTVTLVATWNTSALNFVSNAAVSQLAAPALAAYINSLAVGLPMNLFVLQETFQQAVASVLPAQNLTRLVFAVSINGVGVSPQAGTGIIAGDPESYFFATSAGMVVQQG